MTDKPINPMKSSLEKAARSIGGATPEQLQAHCDRLNTLRWCRNEWIVVKGPDGIHRVSRIA